MRVDPASDTWRYISGWARQEIESALRLLETGSDDVRNSDDKLRGRIAMLRDLLKHGEPPKPERRPETVDYKIQTGP